MRQAGVLAAAGLYALDHHLARLAEDHEHAQLLAKRLGVDPSTVETNMVVLDDVAAPGGRRGREGAGRAGQPGQRPTDPAGAAPGRRPRRRRPRRRRPDADTAVSDARGREGSGHSAGDDSRTGPDGSSSSLNSRLLFAVGWSDDVVVVRALIALLTVRGSPSGGPAGRAPRRRSRAAVAIDVPLIVFVAVGRVPVDW